MNAHSALALVLLAPPAEHDAADGAVEFRDRDHHGGLDRVKPTPRAFPFFQRLELHGLGGEIGHVQLGQSLLGTLGVVVGRAAHEREAAERNHRIDDRQPILHEEPFDGGPLVEACRKGRV